MKNPMVLAQKKMRKMKRMMSSSNFHWLLSSLQLIKFYPHIEI
jgi:hypothetical protein